MTGMPPASGSVARRRHRWVAGGGSKYWYSFDRQAFLCVRMFEDFANFIGRGALRGDAPDGSDQGAEFSGRDVLAEICSRRLGDALFHQSAAEIVGSSFKTGQGLFKPQLDPRNLNIGDVAVQQDPRKRMHDKILVDRATRASASLLEQLGLGVDETQGNKLGK